MLLVKYDDIEEKCIVESDYDPMAFVLPKRFEKYVDKDYGTVAEVGENCESLIFYN